MLADEVAVPMLSRVISCRSKMSLQLLTHDLLMRRDMLPVPQPLQQWQLSPQPSPQVGEQPRMDLSHEAQAPAALHAVGSAERMSRAALVPDATKGGLHTDSGGASTGSDTTPHALPHRPHREQVAGAMLLHASKHMDMGRDGRTP